MSTRVDRDLADVLSKLDPWEREQVLKYARAFQASGDKKPTPSLLKYCGSITKEDAQLMREAIEDAFERV